MTTESLPACGRCGRTSQRLFPHEKLDQVCGTCFEALGRLRPQWSRLEIVGVFGLMLGSALLVIALVALLVR